MFSFLSSLWGRAQVYLAIAGGVVLAIAYAFLKGRASGAQSSTDSIARETQKVNEKFQQIDATSPDFDGSISRLRQRSTKK